MKGMEVDKAFKTGEEVPNGHNKTEYKRKEGISTFIFMDLETTSLLGGTQKPRIAELCLVAVHKADLQDVVVKKKPIIPRMTNKLSICLDPGKPMSFGSSEITGLFNDSLENQKQLSGKTVGLINHFIDHLTKPTCLLAHNGHGFDFPVLKAELNRIGVNLCEDILCADTLEAFRSLDGLPARYDSLASQNHRSIYQGYTPSTQIVWNKAPGVKRKSTEDEICKTNPKVIKHNVDQFDVNLISNDNEHRASEANKVKKKLFVDEISYEGKTTKQNVSDGTKQGKHSKEDTSDFDEFSSSLEDSDYLSALENVENQLRHTDSSTTSAESSQSTDNDSIDSHRSNSSKESISKPKGVDVESCTGYFVRKNEDTYKDPRSDEKVFEQENENKRTSLTTAEQDVPMSSSSSSSSYTTSTSETSSPLHVSPARPESCSGTPTHSTSSTSTAMITQGIVSSTGQTQPVHRQSYSLEQIYVRKFGSVPENSHIAESDSLTLLKVAGQTPELLKWVDQNAVKFSSVKPAF